MERPGIFFKHSLTGLIAVLVGFAISVFFFAQATPPLEASDEARHMGWIIYRVLNRDWPPISVNEPTLARQEATQPPLYYLLGSLVVRGKDLVDYPSCYRPRPEAPIGRADRPGYRNMFVPPAPGKSIPGTWRAVYQVRAFSIVLGCITVLLTGLTALRLLPFQAGTSGFGRRSGGL